MDIVFPADRPGVAQLSADGVQHDVDLFFYGRCGRGFLRFPKGLQCVQRACPGAEILGAEVLSGSFPDVIIDHARVDGMPTAILRIILEKLLPRHIMTLADDTGQAPVAQRYIVMDAFFPDKGEDQLVTVDGDVSVLLGSKSI